MGCVHAGLLLLGLCFLTAVLGDTSCWQIEGWCQEDRNYCPSGYVSGRCYGGATRRCCKPTVPGRLTNAIGLSRIRSYGMTWSASGYCNDANNGRCTSFTNMRTNTLYRLYEFKRALPSGCSIVITGGTEVGHSSGTYSHRNGYKIDIRLQTCIKTYISAKYREIGRRGDGARQWVDSRGNVYALESNHWDIKYTR